MQKQPIEEVQPSAVQAGDDEVSLIALSLALRKRWLWLLAGVLCGGLVAITYIALTAPIYRSHASVEVGKVHEFGLIEDPDTLVVQLADQYGQGSGNTARETAYLRQVTKVPGKNDLLKLEAVGSSPEQARDFLAQIVTMLLRRHEQLYANALHPLRQRLTAIESQIVLLTTQAKDLGRLIERSKESQPVQASVVAIERGNIYRALSELERDRVVLQQRTSPPYSNPSRVIAQVTLERNPAAPRKTSAAVLGIMVGLVFGLLAVFFAEFATRPHTSVMSDARK